MARLTDSEASLLLQDGQDMFMGIPGLVAQTGVWAVYIVLAVFSLHCIRKRRKQTTASRCLAALVLLMFAASTLLLTADLFRFFFHIKMVLLAPVNDSIGEKFSSSMAAAPVTYARDWLFSIEFLIGDAVIIWRTWVLWQGSWAMAVPCIFWLAWAGMFFAERIIFIRTPGALEGLLFSNYTSVPILSNVSWSMSVATNAVATAMIASKAWQYRKFIKESLGREQQDKPTTVERVFSLLVESGALYIIYWTISLACNDEEYSPSLIFTIIWNSVGNHVVALYPTAIIAVVELQRSIRDDIDNIPCFSSTTVPSGGIEIAPRTSEELTRQTSQMMLSGSDGGNLPSGEAR